MLSVWKFILDETDEQIIQIPFGAEFLTVQVQHGSPCLWALVDTDAPLVPMKILVVGTGKEVPDNTRYIGTCHLFKGTLVLHVFEGEV